MTAAEFIAAYGYWGVLAGALVEGETLLALGGLAAHFGYLKLTGVILVAFCGGVIGDQACFFAGRYGGHRILARFPRFQARADHALEMVGRHCTWLALTCRFMYGLRIAVPFTLGMTRMSALRFTLLNLIGAAFWAVVVPCLGYLFGEAVQAVIGDMRRYEVPALVGLAMVGCGLWAYFALRERRAKRLAEKTPSPPDQGD